MSSSFGVPVRCMTFVARDEVGMLSECGYRSEGVGEVGFCIVAWYLVVGLPSCLAL